MYAVIMAGGGGTRLWPLSRARRPKPFLPLLEGGRSLLAATVERLAPLVDVADTYVVTDARYAAMVRESVPGIPAANIVGEPMGRNTAAAIALAACALERPPDEVMAVLPADHVIRDAAGFRAALASAAGRAAEGDLVTLGIEPSEPVTGYGYIIAGGPPSVHGGRPTFRVERFEEKPSLARARELVASRDAYWNGGIFVWRRASVLAGLERHAADVLEAVRAWLALVAPGGAAGPPQDARADLYARVRAISIDYALLEPASLEGQVAVVPASIGWSDLGSWAALRDERRTDGASGVTAEPPASVIEVAGRDLLVHAAGGRTVAVVGLQDVIVVDTPDALLVTSAEAAQEVRQVVERLRAEGRDELL